MRCGGTGIGSRTRKMRASLERRADEGVRGSILRSRRDSGARDGPVRGTLAPGPLVPDGCVFVVIIRPWGAMAIAMVLGNAVADDRAKDRSQAADEERGDNIGAFLPSGVGIGRQGCSQSS